MRGPLRFVLEQSHRRDGISSVDGESVIDPVLNQLLLSGVKRSVSGSERTLEVERLGLPFLMLV